MGLAKEPSLTGRERECRQPEAIAAGVAQVRASGGRKQITDALANAGTPPALSALSALAHDPAAPLKARVDALTAFVMVSSPSIEAMRASMDLLRQPAEA